MKYLTFVSEEKMREFHSAIFESVPRADHQLALSAVYDSLNDAVVVRPERKAAWSFVELVSGDVVAFHASERLLANQNTEVYVDDFFFARPKSAYLAKFLVALRKSAQTDRKNSTVAFVDHLISCGNQTIAGCKLSEYGQMGVSKIILAMTEKIENFELPLSSAADRIRRLLGKIGQSTAA